ncbi:MAG: transporter [Acidobacteria bacterium]|nr:transporter [Acidobacteriota bacterium]
MNKPPVYVYLCMCLVLFPALTRSGLAADEALITDRPDYTESAFVVPLYRIQLESGLTWQRLAAGEHEINAAEMLVRWSFLPRLELRLGVPDYVWLRSGKDHSGFVDSSIGLKVQLGPAGAEWGAAFLATLFLPTGEDEFTSNGYDPELKFVLSRDLSERVGLAGQVVAAWPTAAADREFFWASSLVAGFGISQRWGAFTELIVEFPETGDAAVMLQHGYTCQLAEHVQLDIRVGAGLNDAAPDVYVGAGLAVLF